MHSSLYVDELLYQAAHADVGQTTYAFGCQTQSLSGWTDSHPLCFVSFYPSIYGRRRCSTIVNHLNNCFLKIR
jgi:hypothetical protein